MIKTILTLTLFSLFLSCSAEEISISLGGRKLSIVIPGYYITDVVLSQREDSCLGYLHPFGPNKCIPIFFGNSIRSEVKEFLMNSMPEQAEMKQVIIRVNRIFIYQVSVRERDYACLDLSLSFIRPGKNLTEDFTSAVTVSEVQHFHPKNLGQLMVNAFDSGFSQYLKRLKLGLLVPVMITPEQLRENPLSQPGYYKCFTAKKPRKGLYRTFFDFRDNLPDTSFDFKILHDYNKNHPKLSRAYLKFSEGSKPGKFWGFCEGDSVYFNGGRSFSLLTHEGDQYTTYNRSSDYSRDVASAAIIGGIFGGFLGASLFGGIAAVSSDPDLMVKFRLDLFDGKLLPCDARDYTMVSSTIIFFLSKVSDPGATLSVFVDGQLRCEMKPGNYFTLDISCHYSIANIKLVSSTGGEVTEQLEANLLKTEVYLLKVKKDHTIFTGRLFDQMKTDMLKERTKENTVCRAELFNN
jgi:hypothetical protein